MSTPDSRRTALRPFTPRVAEIDYISQPEGPVVFVAPSGSFSADCAADYPFDPRNLSLFDTSILANIIAFDGDFLETFAGDSIIII